MAKKDNGKAEGAESGQVQINILAQYLKDLSFESPKAPDSLKDPGANPNVQIDVNVSANPLEDNVYESSINLKAEAKTDKGAVYLIETHYAGAFRIEGLPEEHLKPFLLINCPALLFPFLRRIIADMTQEGGFPPLMLDPIDFAGLYQQRAAKDAEEQGKKADS